MKTNTNSLMRNPGDVRNPKPGTSWLAGLGAPKSPVAGGESGRPAQAATCGGQADTNLRLSWLAVALALLAAPLLAVGQSPVPEAMNYQGKLTDTGGKPLSNGLYQVEFRLWDDATSTNSGDYIWGRAFPIYVVSNGLFNVLLAQEGGGTLTWPNSTGKVSSLLYAFDDPDRYLGLRITQTPLGPVTGPAEISPRQRLATAPYAFHAQQATAAATAAFANNAVNFGSFQTNDFLMANKSSQTLTGSLTVTNGTLTVKSNVTATAFVGYGTIPIGGIVMWSGATNAIPAGWALCDGTTNNNHATPDLRNRFVVGAGARYAVGDTGGADTVTLTTNQMPAHTHNYTQGDRQSFFGHGAYDNMWVGTGATVATSSTGDGQAHENRPPYYALCYIMRVQ